MIAIRYFSVTFTDWYGIIFCFHIRGIFFVFSKQRIFPRKIFLPLMSFFLIFFFVFSLFLFIITFKCSALQHHFSFVCVHTVQSFDLVFSLFHSSMYFTILSNFNQVYWAVCFFIYFQFSATSRALQAKKAHSIFYITISCPKLTHSS